MPKRETEFQSLSQNAATPFTAFIERDSHAIDSFSTSLFLALILCQDYFVTVSYYSFYLILSSYNLISIYRSILDAFLEFFVDYMISKLFTL